MSNDRSAAIVSKVWNYAHVLKNAGVGSGDSIEVRAARASINCLLFLKLAPPPPRLRRAGSEMTELGFDNPSPDAFAWTVLSGKSGDDLESSGARGTIRKDGPKGWLGGANQIHYRHSLGNLGKDPSLGGKGACLAS